MVTSINCSHGLLNSGCGLVNREHGLVNREHGIKTKLFLYIVVFRGSVNKQSWWYECLYAGLLYVQHVAMFVSATDVLPQQPFFSSIPI